MVVWQAKVALLVLLVGIVWLNYSRVDMSQAWDAREQGVRIFDVLPRDSVFIGSWADIPVLEYLQIVEGQRPDVRLRNVVLMSEQRAVAEATTASLAGRAYVGGLYKQLAAGDFRAVRVGRCPCYRLLSTAPFR